LQKVAKKLKKWRFSSIFHRWFAPFITANSSHPNNLLPMADENNSQ